ncbi:hypothetical protein IP68_13755 [Blastomonas sp. AAP25]|nr:hypothetical protein IP68_13755 [Blastomonas sp. AAP25]
MYKAVRKLEISTLATALVADHDHHMRLGAKSANIFLLRHIIKITAELSDCLVAETISQGLGQSIGSAGEARKHQRLAALADFHRDQLGQCL